MPDPSIASSGRTPPPPPKDSLAKVICKIVGVLAFLTVLGWSYGGAEMAPMKLITHRGNMWTYLREFGDLDFTEWRMYAREMAVTIQIAIWGTFLAVALAVPFGLLSASNLMPWWVYWPVRRLMDVFRATNEMILAIIFSVAVGPGPFAGVLALFVHTLGTLAKLFAESVEAIDPRPVEGIRATGASAVDEINYAVIPQVMPLWMSYSLYRFESNVRSASVVGMVGAGGIGFQLTQAMGSFQYGRVSAMILIVIAAVVTLDILSGVIRKRFT